MAILENELVLKFFTCDCGGFSCRTRIANMDKAHMALRILEAMGKPVVEGKLYLAISEYGPVTGPVVFTSSDHHKHHGHWLVLPDRFQPPKGEYQACGCKIGGHYGSCQFRTELPKDVEKEEYCCAACLATELIKNPPPPSKVCEWGNEKYGRIDPDGDPCGCRVCKNAPAPDGGADEVAKIVNKVMDRVYYLPLGTTLNEAKGFLKKVLAEALQSKPSGRGK